MKTSKRKHQQKIYDGKQAGYKPIYADQKFFKSYMDSHIADAKDHHMLGVSFKAARNMAEIRKLKLRPGMKVLDIGCGGGILINQLHAMYGITGFGADISPLALSRARQAGSKKIKYARTAAEKLPFKKNVFDAVVSFDVLEHVENKEKYLNEIVRVLKPGGKFLVYAVSSRDFLTWHWFLRLVTFGKYGHDTEGGHDRKEFASPYRTAAGLASAGAKRIKLSFLHSFFTLLTDEILFKIQKKLAGNVYKAKGKSINAGAVKPGKKVMAYRVIRAFRPIFELLELPWKIAGLSNGFFISGEK